MEAVASYITEENMPNSLLGGSQPVAIDLFAGAGLFSSAFALAGIEVILALEQEDVACQTYAMNVGNHIVRADVTTYQDRPHCNVLIAGPPCQGFSTLNRSRNSDSRRFLALEVINWAKLCGPQIVIVENVASFLGSSTHLQLTVALEELGYLVSSRTLDACHFGVAQYRKRSFTIASTIGEFNWPTPSELLVTVKDAWYGLSDVPTNINHHSSPRPTELALRRMTVIPPEGSKQYIVENHPELIPPSWRRSRLELTDVWGRLRWNKPSNTLRTCLQNPSKGRYIHPTQHRVITLREAARLHSIPDTWTFAGYPTQIARQIGNSVPPNLGYAIAKATRQHFN